MADRRFDSPADDTSFIFGAETSLISVYRLDSPIDGTDFIFDESKEVSGTGSSGGAVVQHLRNLGMYR